MGGCVNNCSGRGIDVNSFEKGSKRKSDKKIHSTTKG